GTYTLSLHDALPISVVAGDGLGVTSGMGHSVALFRTRECVRPGSIRAWLSDLGSGRGCLHCLSDPPAPTTMRAGTRGAPQAEWAGCSSSLARKLSRPPGRPVAPSGACIAANSASSGTQWGGYLNLAVSSTGTRSDPA